MSTSKAYPHGLSNNHGQVGKYYRPQVTLSINGLYPGKELNVWAGTSGQTFVIDDYNGQANDPNVVVNFYVSNGVNRTSDGGIPIAPAFVMLMTPPPWL